MSNGGAIVARTARSGPSPRGLPDPARSRCDRRRGSAARGSSQVRARAARRGATLVPRLPLHRKGAVRAHRVGQCCERRAEYPRAGESRGIGNIPAQRKDSTGSTRRPKTGMRSRLPGSRGGSRARVASRPTHRQRIARGRDGSASERRARNRAPQRADRVGRHDRTRRRQWPVARSCGGNGREIPPSRARMADAGHLIRTIGAKAMTIRWSLHCPRCDSQDARPIRRWRIGDYVAALIARRPFACQVCRRRFRSAGRASAETAPERNAA